MTAHICEQCGMQFAEAESPPHRCPVCEDERQFVNWKGQRWTTLDHLRKHHANRIAPEGPGIIGVGTRPKFAIGQRALLLQTGAGNILWDCVSLLDDETVRQIRDLGGLSAIAISHPHYYASCVEWSRAFDNAPIYLHAADREWVMRPDPAMVFWEGDRHPIREGLTLVRFGGHFRGGTVLHWADGADGRGALFSGDIIQVVPDRRFVSFMYSYPNLIPLDAGTVKAGVSRLAGLEFEALYGAWWGFAIPTGAQGAVRRSLTRYLCAIQEGRTDCVDPAETGN
jgi:hypothetical protein